MFHIYKEINFECEPLCYYESEADEHGMLLEFQTEEAAKRFIESAVASGDCDEEFFNSIFIEEGYKDYSTILRDNLLSAIEELKKKNNISSKDNK